MKCKQYAVIIITWLLHKSMRFIPMHRGFENETTHFTNGSKYPSTSYLSQIFHLCKHKAHFVKEDCMYTGKMSSNQNIQMARRGLTRTSYKKGLSQVMWGNKAEPSSIESVSTVRERTHNTVETLKLITHMRDRIKQSKGKAAAVTLTTLRMLES